MSKLGTMEALGFTARASIVPQHPQRSATQCLAQRKRDATDFRRAASGVQREIIIEGMSCNAYKHGACQSCHHIRSDLHFSPVVHLNSVETIL